MASDSKRLKIFRTLPLCFRVFCSHCLCRFRSENDLRYIVTVSDVSSCRNFYIQFCPYICEMKTKTTVNFVVAIQNIMLMMTLPLSDDTFLTILFTFLIAQRITGLYASLCIVHSYLLRCICISLCNILYFHVVMFYI